MSHCPNCTDLERELATIRAALCTLAEVELDTGETTLELVGLVALDRKHAAEKLAASEEARRVEREKIREAFAGWHTSHSMHWDKQGTSGANCPACIEDRKLRGVLMAVFSVELPVAPPPPEVCKACNGQRGDYIERIDDGSTRGKVGEWLKCEACGGTGEEKLSV